MKMKNYLMMLCVAAAVMTALPATAQSYEPFVPVYCSAGYGGRPVVAPVSEITFSFYGSLAGSDGATGRIMRGDEIMAEGPIEVSNYAGQKRTQSFATIRFDGELLLPKGYDYTVVRSGDSMHSIAQRYGIRLKNLYKMNKLPDDYIPSVGDRLKLR